MHKLYRSSRDRKILGVCGGLADYFNIDSTLIRILLIIVAVFSAGSVILVYVIAGFVIPSESRFGGGFGWNPPPGPSSRPSYGTPPNWPPGGSWSGQAGGSSYGPPPQSSGPAQASPPPRMNVNQGIDAMMEDLEKKALRREIDELKARLNKFEKDSKGE